jgi:hypothetical protein
MTRSWASEVVCKRSTASAATDTAVSKPKVTSVPTMSLSIVLGTPTHGTPVAVQPLRGRQRAFAADDDETCEIQLGHDPLRLF